MSYISPLVLLKTRNRRQAFCSFFGRKLMSGSRVDMHLRALNDAAFEFRRSFIH